MRTVEEMFSIAVDNDKPLLSKYPAIFWADYVANYKHYDLLFRRLYRSFSYFMQDESETLANITDNFTQDVYNHLLLNDKKYAELYRVNVVNDEEYSILNNYDIHETMARTTGNDTTYKTSGRTDKTTSDSTQGAQTNTSKTGIEGFNSSDFSDSEKTDETIGQRKDTNTQDYTTGSETNTTNESGKEDYTLTRKGNIGVQTSTDIMRTHYQFWRPFEFYSFIFGEIAKELLIV